MKDYFIHWWRGDLEEHFRFLWFSISQVNKLSKAGLYFIGLLALFDLSKFTNVVDWIRKLSAISIGVIRFVQVVLSAPIIALGLVFAIYGRLFRQLKTREAIAFPFLYVLDEAQKNAQAASQKHLLVRYLDWLKQQPITERQIKGLGFVLFVVFAFVELLTS